MALAQGRLASRSTISISTAVMVWSFLPICSDCTAVDITGHHEGVNSAGASRIGNPKAGISLTAELRQCVYLAQQTHKLFKEDHSINVYPSRLRLEAESL